MSPAGGAIILLAYCALASVVAALVPLRRDLS
jgi:hypothetical protein